MALFNSPFFKKLKGHFDRWVFYESKGQQRIRRQIEKKPLPPTNLQILQRHRMRSAIAFYRANTDKQLRWIWKKKAAGMVMSGYNLFIGSNIAAFDRNCRIVDYSLLHISTGSLELPPYFQLQSCTESEVILNWQKGVPENSDRNKDQLMAAYLTNDGCFSLKWLPLTGVYRKDGQAILNIPEWTKGEIHLYCFFANRKQEKYSPEKYFQLRR